MSVRVRRVVEVVTITAGAAAWWLVARRRAFEAEVRRLQAHPFAYRFGMPPMTPQLKDLIDRAHEAKRAAAIS